MRGERDNEDIYEASLASVSHQKVSCKAHCE